MKPPKYHPAPWEIDSRYERFGGPRRQQPRQTPQDAPGRSHVPSVVWAAWIALGLAAGGLRGFLAALAVLIVYLLISTLAGAGAHCGRRWQSGMGRMTRDR